MNLEFTSNLPNLNYFLSGKKAFFHRHCDTGFKNKWTGLWAMPFKFLEYFAFKIDNEWLSPDTAVRFISDQASSTHEFMLKELKVREYLFVPENHKALVCILTLKNLSNEAKVFKIDLETAVNIRSREENWHDRKYDKSVQVDRVVVKSSKGAFVFGSMIEGAVVSPEEYKDHSPSGEKQRYFLPGVYRISVDVPSKGKKEVKFIFACGENEIEAYSGFEYVKEYLSTHISEDEMKYSSIFSGSIFRSGTDSLDKLFRLSVTAVEKLSFDSNNGLGYFAGLPWFTQFWGRDSGWIIPAVVDYGNFESAKESLKTLAEHQSETGTIPHAMYMDGNVDYNSIDSTPLWIIALEHYVSNSGDIKFLEEVWSNLEKALEFFRSRSVDGLITNNKGETWMDTLDREGNAIEVQAFWIEAIKSSSRLYKILGKQVLSDKLKNEFLELKAKFEMLFWNEKENFYYDNLAGPDSNKKTINPIFPLFFRLGMHQKKVLEIFEKEEFNSKYGVRTLSKYEDGFDPKGYHTGSVWGFTNMIFGCVEFINGREGKGLNMLEAMGKRMFEDCVGAIGEAWDSDTGKLIGCGLQGWSSALAIRCIDEFFLGLNIDAFEDSIIVSPHLKDGMCIERRKRIGNDIVDLMIERKDNNLNVDYTSHKGRVYKIILAPNM
jgi:hypothetical protein